MSADPVAIARDLLRCPSVTPAEGGALSLTAHDPRIARLAVQAAAKGMNTIVSTGDKDLAQLVNDKVRVLNPPKDNLICDRAKVEEILGVPPERVVDVMALRGDSIDNIPGAPGIGERLKRSVVVENRAGSNGEIAAASVAKAPADGSVFMLASNGSTTVAAALKKDLPYDVRIDFAAVAPVGINPMLLVVRPDLPVKDVNELIALAHSKPGKLNGASAGAGGATHLGLELFKSMARADIVHVPYKGGGQAMNDVLAGKPEMMFQVLGAALPQIEAGKLRPLAVSGTAREPVTSCTARCNAASLPDRPQSGPESGRCARLPSRSCACRSRETRPAAGRGTWVSRETAPGPVAR